MDQQNRGGPKSNHSQQSKGAIDESTNQVKETFRGATDSLSEAARGAYEQGERFVREARERYPEAERYYRDGSELVRHSAESLLIALMVGVGLGFVLARVVDLVSESSREDVPDYARRR